MKQHTNTDFETRSLDAVCVNESQLTHKWYHNIKYLVVGVLFGIVFVKSEVVSWFRIQEMFRLQSFQMYGIIGSAIVVGMTSIWLIKNSILKPFTEKVSNFIRRLSIKVRYLAACYSALVGPLQEPVRGRFLRKLERVQR